MTATPVHEVPPSAAMMGLITGYWISQAVGVVALLGVADQLEDGPRTATSSPRQSGQIRRRCTECCGCSPASASSRRSRRVPSG